MNNGRKYVRRQASDYLLATDTDSSKVLGRIANMSPKGIMLMSADALAVGQSYRLSIKLPAKVSNHEHLSVTAECRWSTFKKRSDLWENGLEIGEITPDSRKLLQQVVLRLMEHNGQIGEVSDAKWGQGNEKLELVRVRRYRR